MIPALCCLLLLAGACTREVRQERVTNAGPAGMPSFSSTEEALGIQVVGLRWTASGLMLDFRYRVTDPEKTDTVFSRAIKPYIIHERTGARFVIPSSPKVGPMRQTTRKPETGRVYWLLFANPDRYVKQGDRVTVVIGDHRLEHVIVE